MTDPNGQQPSSPATIQPELKRSKGISILWILPLLALGICSWLLYQSIQNAGIEITVYFEDAKGITTGKTQVMSKGIPVGLVKKLEPDIANNRVKATIVMDKLTEPYLVTDTLFWVVRPELSAASVRGLETILTGSYLGIRAGTSNTRERVFKGLPSPPPVSTEAPGLHIILKAEALGSIQRETGVYYKNIEIGNVQDYRFADGNFIHIDIHIKPEYAGIVKKDSRFCNASGFTISGELTKLKVQVESFASLLRGGILIHTPEEVKESPPAENGAIFKLYKDFEDANYGIPMTLQLASGEDIIEGSTKLMYRGIEAGFVKEIQVNDDERKTVTALIHLDPRAEFILRENTAFWLVKPVITPAGVKNLRTLLAGSHITFRPGDGKYTNHFTILPEPPPQTPQRPGSFLQLKSENGVSLTARAPLYFKDIQVGEVVHIELAPGTSDIYTTLFLYEPYQKLVRDDSIFWLQHGMEVEADLAGVRIETGPLARVLAGGIVFTTPEASVKSTKPQIFPDKIFTLYESYSSAVAATPALQPQGVHFRLQSSDVAGLSIGTPILNRNVKIGHVTGFSLSPDNKSVFIDCFIEQKHRNLLNSSTRFYHLSAVELSGGLSGVNLRVDSVESFLRGGIGCITGNSSRPISPKKPLSLFASLEEALHADDTVITVTFPHEVRIKKGSPLRFKGVDVGKVVDIGFGKDLDTVEVMVRVDDIAAPLFRTTTRIWQVVPEISLSGIRNVETAVFGAYLTFHPGAGRPQKKFVALTKTPQIIEAGSDGLSLILKTRHLGSLSAGSPLYYRELKVGEVTGFELAPSFRNVLVFVRIEQKYAAIIRENTRFWNISGARVSGGLFSGISLTTGSLESIIRGGIALATPDNEAAGRQVASGYHFDLHDQAEDTWLDWTPDIVLMEAEKEQ